MQPASLPQPADPAVRLGQDDPQRQSEEPLASQVSIPPARHSAFWLVLGLAAALRFPLLLLTDGSDYWFYLNLGRLSNLGYYPYLHYWLEYPPVFPWLAVAAYRFSLTFPPIFYGSFDRTYHALLGSVIVTAELGIVALVYLIGLRLGSRDEALRRTMLYAALFWPVAVAQGWYDALPAVMLLLGLYLLLRGQGGGAGALAGLGFMTKLFPIVLVPVAIKFLPRWRDRLTAGAAALVVTLALAVPLLWLSPTYFLASYRATLSRSAWETIWALLDGYYSYGKVAPLGVRFDPSTAGYVAYLSRLPNLAIALGFVLLFLGLWLRPVARTPRNTVLFTALATLLFLLYSKGYSPQFILYVLPFVAILLPWRRAIGYAALLSLVNLLQWPLYHEWLGEVHWVLGVAVVGRTLLWLGLAWEWLAELWRWPNLLRTIDRRVTLAAAALVVLAACPASIAAWQTWTVKYYNGSPLRPAYDFVRRHDSGQRAAFIFADDDLYQRFYPYFRERGDFYLFRPPYTPGATYKDARLTPAGQVNRLDELAATHSQIFFIRNADDWTSRDINRWLTTHTNLGAALRAENVDISVWQRAAP